MNEWLNFVLLSCICYRLAQLIALDEGPFGIFNKLRIKIGACDYGENGQAKTGLGRAITCPYCLGVWIALPLSLYATGIDWSMFVWWFAIAGGQAFLQGLNK